MVSKQTLSENSRDSLCTFVVLLECSSNCIYRADMYLNIFFLLLFFFFWDVFKYLIYARCGTSMPYCHVIKKWWLIIELDSPNNCVILYSCPLSPVKCVCVLSLSFSKKSWVCVPHRKRVFAIEYKAFIPPLRVTGFWWV